MQYKSSKYKYIPSRLYEPKKKTGMDYTDNNFMNYNQYYNQYQQQNKQQKKIVRPNSAFVGTNKNKNPSSSDNQEQKYIYNQINNIGENEPKQLSMFDKYYKEKNENKDYQMNPNYYNDLEKEIFLNQKKEVNIDANDANKNIKEENENENIREAINRPPKEINQQKNYIEANKHLITKIQNANNTNKLKEYYDKKENPYHKEYGKIPKYIENMKLENEKKLEKEKLRKETAKYPKGTRLLSEEERLFTLKQNRDDINKVNEKLPITSDTQTFKNKKDELFKKLDKIENAIEIFSKKKVFVKVEDK